MGALRNDCTKEEIFEVFLDTTTYCGFPAAYDSIKVVKEFSGEPDRKATRT
jgi:4-carboxymuconolactone decarboxylase